MTRTSYPSADALFAAATSLPAAERAGYLRRACGADEQLYSKVHTLLESLSEVAGR